MPAAPIRRGGPPGARRGSAKLILGCPKMFSKKPLRRRRPGRRLAFQALETRALMSVGGGEITALFGAGFNPTELHLNGSAALAGTSLRLTDGGPDEVASAYYTNQVDAGGGFTTAFDFRLTPHGTDPLGTGFTFNLQNDLGVTENPSTPWPDRLGLGLNASAHFAVSFQTFATDLYPADIPNGALSDNATGLYLGDATPKFVDTDQVAIPKSLVDLHSGHVFRATLTYTPPAGGAAGDLLETLKDTATGPELAARLRGREPQEPVPEPRTSPATTSTPASPGRPGARPTTAATVTPSRRASPPRTSSTGAGPTPPRPSRLPYAARFSLGAGVDDLGGGRRRPR